MHSRGGGGGEEGEDASHKWCLRNILTTVALRAGISGAACRGINFTKNLFLSVILKSDHVLIFLRANFHYADLCNTFKNNKILMVRNLEKNTKLLRVYFMHRLFSYQFKKGQSIFLKRSPLPFYHLFVSCTIINHPFQTFGWIRSLLIISNSE